MGRHGHSRLEEYNLTKFQKSVMQSPGLRKEDNNKSRTGPVYCLRVYKHPKNLSQETKRIKTLKSNIFVLVWMFVFCFFGFFFFSEVLINTSKLASFCASKLEGYTRLSAYEYTKDDSRIGCQ